MLEDLAAALREQPGAPIALPPLDVRRAAVAAVLDPGGRLLFIKRAEHEGDPWSGHMAFPGGRVDPVDATVQAAAERETLEEVGLDLDARGRLLGRLDEQRSPVSRGPMSLIITPFVYGLRAGAPPLDLNEEVAAVHWFDVERLASGEGRGHFDLEWRGQVWAMPRLDLDGVRIWGLTLRMLDDLLLRLGVDLGAEPYPRDPRLGDG